MQYIDLLKDIGLKATPQRLCILKTLAKHTHPTIDELYDEIKKDYPSISLATVYKNLGTLLDCGLVTEVLRPNLKSKFDIKEKPHIHIVCKKCGYVKDCDCETSDLKNYHKILEKNTNTKIDDLNITAFVDECQNCKN
ncbi:transcriptional repressor [Campylobacter ureolyticus]|uniref:Fur family transcriptional regulator n=1 Tax=Campylobacter ureolyticus TaxID=827 RepID=UPI00215A22EB|nr:Fur family transcriptional regulator [Campylobacter ureolyticus]MCR8699605.1 transcriptional repressor [Campylobacter ureolyticus]